MLLSIPGVGLLTATAMVAATRGEVGHSPRRAPLRLLVRVYPKGPFLSTARRDRRPARWHAHRSLRQWTLAVQAAPITTKPSARWPSKLARICYATLRNGEAYRAAHLNKKIDRAAFALPA